MMGSHERLDDFVKCACCGAQNRRIGIRDGGDFYLAGHEKWRMLRPTRNPVMIVIDMVDGQPLCQFCRQTATPTDTPKATPKTEQLALF